MSSYLALLPLLGSLVAGLPQAAKPAAVPPFPFAPPPPCTGDYLPNDVFFNPNGVKPNICFVRDKTLQFDLTCAAMPQVSEKLFNVTFKEFGDAVNSSMKSDPSKDPWNTQLSPDFKLATRCAQALPMGVAGAPVAGAAAAGSTGMPYKTPEKKTDGACVQVQVAPLDGQHFTVGGLSDILTTIARLPQHPAAAAGSTPKAGKDSKDPAGSYTCRIDVHTMAGELFGTGCIQQVPGFDPLTPAPCPGPDVLPAYVWQNVPNPAPVSSPNAGTGQVANQQQNAQGAEPDAAGSHPSTSEL